MKVGLFVSLFVLLPVVNPLVFSETSINTEINKIVAAKLLQNNSLGAVQVDIINSLLGDVTNGHLVSEFVVGRENVISFLASSAQWLPYQQNYRNLPEGLKEYLAAPDGIEIAVLSSNQFYGAGKKMPVIIFDAAFDGKGIATLEDLIVGLEYETSRLPFIMRGLRYNNFSLSRDEYLQIDLQVKKTVLEALAMDNIFIRIFSGARRVSKQFYHELQLNFIKYLKILDAVADGYYWYINPRGNPVHISTARDIRLAQAQLEQLQFTVGIEFNQGKEVEVISKKKSISLDG